jgi:LVIVD repeat-containing protein
MPSVHQTTRSTVTSSSALVITLAFVAAGACARTTSATAAGNLSPVAAPMGAAVSYAAPSPDPRVGLKAGLFNAGEAAWNMRLVSTTQPQGQFMGSTNSDLAFLGNYAIQGNYNGYQIWDISDPAHPTLKVGNYCPASQSDVSVYKNLLFVSAEGNSGRIDCGGEGVKETVSTQRIRGIRIFDVTDIAHPRNVANVQTCRGSHTHTVLVDPKDPENVYVYVSGSAPVRSAEELPGCSNADPSQDPNSARFRIEVIKVPLAHPEQAAIVSSPRIFNDLAAPPTHGASSADKAEIANARAHGGFVVNIFDQDMVLPSGFVKQLLDSVVKKRGGTGAPTAADSAQLRADLPAMIQKMFGGQGPRRGPTQCHDITVYPAVGYAGGACEGYGFLLDIHDPAHPVRVAAVSDSNFSYWHSATFNNDGTKLLFSDEWGGGGQPKCRATDPKDWGADAIFTIEGNSLKFQSYYKMSAPQTAQENCVAHNGSLIPIPGRDVMVQAWYQGGISVFDWTDAAHPKEIAFFDRGPVDSTRMASGGSWSVYWYNGVMVSSEIARGLDIFELAPSPMLSQNEIDAAKSVHLDYMNTQGQPKFVWPASFSLARAYVDQLERSGGLSASRIAAVRQSLTAAEQAGGSARSSALSQLASQIEGDANGSSDSAKVRKLASAVQDLSRA